MSFAKLKIIFCGFFAYVLCPLNSYAGTSVEALDTNEKNDVSNPEVITQDQFLSSLSSDFNFSEAQIDGSRKSPFTHLLTGRQKLKFNPIVDLRKDFRKEVFESRKSLKALVK